MEPFFLASRPTAQRTPLSLTAQSLAVTRDRPSDELSTSERTAELTYLFAAAVLVLHRPAALASPPTGEVPTDFSLSKLASSPEVSSTVPAG